MVHCYSTFYISIKNKFNWIAFLIWAPTENNKVSFLGKNFWIFSLNLKTIFLTENNNFLTDIEPTVYSAKKKKKKNCRAEPIWRHAKSLFAPCFWQTGYSLVRTFYSWRATYFTNLSESFLKLTKLLSVFVGSLLGGCG